MEPRSGKASCLHVVVGQLLTEVIPGWKVGHQRVEIAKI
jgi:hypothetical protein